MYLLMIEQERKRYELMLDRADQVSAAELSGVTLTAHPMKVADGVARIPIIGVLTPQLDEALGWWGIENTAYDDIISQVVQAEGNPDVREIVFDVDSGGGDVVGLFDAMDAIAAARKPTRAIVGGMAASAAYGLASQAGHIEASGRASIIGSVGVVTSRYISKYIVDITSTEAPDKRPDAGTAEGVAAIRSELDQIHDLFADSIASGRGITAEKVNSDFGRGAVMVAGKALEAGMIDSLRGHGAPDNSNPKAAASGEEVNDMDLNELKAKHPDVFNAAVQEGVDQERDRVGAHLTMGEMGGMDTALKAVKEGTGMTLTLQAEYLKAAANTQTANDRVDDNGAAEAVDPGKLSAKETDTLEATAEGVADAVDRAFGVDNA